MNETWFTIAAKRMQCLGIQVTLKGPVQGELHTIAKGNQRGHKQMGKHFMLIDRTNQYHENDHNSQSNL